MSADTPLIRAITDPDCLPGLGAAEWNDLLRQARRYGLLARLRFRLGDSGHFDQVPERAKAIMQDAVIEAHYNETSLEFEINRIRRALSEDRIPFILLKGGAYLGARLPIAPGRLSTDLDILVRADDLQNVKQSLIDGGWRVAVDSEYDKRYYEEWMHEIAPMVHAERQTAVDVHHAISPRTSRVQPDVEALWAASVETESGFRVLAPADLVLHSGLHLVNEEFVAGLRDLVDLHDLLTYYGSKEPAFWRDLELSAERHGLHRVLYYVLELTTSVFGTPVPDAVLRKARDAAPGRRLGRLIIWLMKRAIFPAPTARDARLRSLAYNALYVRSHWLRMPPPLLFRHLSAKAWFRIRAALPGGAPS